MRNTIPSRNAGKHELLKSQMHSLEGKQIEKLQVVTILESPHLDRTWLVVDFHLVRVQKRKKGRRGFYTVLLCGPVVEENTSGMTRIDVAHGLEAASRLLPSLLCVYNTHDLTAAIPRNVSVEVNTSL